MHVKLNYKLWGGVPLTIFFQYFYPILMTFFFLKFSTNYFLVKFFSFSQNLLKQIFIQSPAKSGQNYIFTRILVICGQFSKNFGYKINHISKTTNRKNQKFVFLALSQLRTCRRPPLKKSHFHFLGQKYCATQCSETNEKSIFRFLIYQFSNYGH